MWDVRVDKDGNLRCWKCGNGNFLTKRTFGAKLTMGPFSLLTKKKLKCQVCGSYNKMGNAQTKPAFTTRDLVKQLKERGNL